MKNCKNLTTSEVQMIMNGATMFVEPMKQNKYSYFGVPFCEEYPDLEAGLYVSTVVDKWGEEDAGPEIWGAISGKGEYCWKSPYQPGQIIYGREPWMRAPNLNNAYGQPMEPIKYKASVTAQYIEEWSSRWSSAAAMPKEAARIFLRIESVSVKRCQDVTQSDALSMVEVLDFPKPIESFQSYYISRFGQESWDNNDWIWLFTFTRVNSING